MKEPRPNAIPLAVLTDAVTGRRVIVSGMWLRTLAETKEATTVITFTSGD